MPGVLSTSATDDRDEDSIVRTAANAMLLMTDNNRHVSMHMQQYEELPSPPDSDNEDDTEQPCPVIAEAVGDLNGPDADARMITATNLSITEFNLVWDDVKGDVKQEFECARGRRFRDTLKDIFFMTVCTLKHRATWEWHAIGFNREKSTLKRMVTKMLRVLHPIMKCKYIEYVRDDFEMDKLRPLQSFKDFPSVLCATDVVFQDANRPRGNLQEAKPYYSKKHAAYGFKTEVSVLANGQAVFCSKPARGATPDITVYRKNIAAHKKLLKKTEKELEMDDHEQDQGRWEDLLDKGYIGLRQNGIRAVTPKKKPANGRLSREDHKKNVLIAAARVLVENFFGRRAMLWGMMAERFRMPEDDFEMYSTVCTALTNVHIHFHPLRASDNKHYKTYRKRIYAVGIEKQRRRQAQAARSRRNHIRRVTRSIRARIGADAADAEVTDAAFALFNSDVETESDSE